MNYPERLLLRLAGLSLAILLSTALAAGQASPNPAIATPTVNIDEPGRIPFQTAVLGTCNGTFCSASFKPVPAGHRLVIRHVSAQIQSADPVPDETKALIAVESKSGFISFPVAPFVSGVFIGGFDQAIELYVDAGQTPTVTVNLGVSQLNIFIPTVVGYELDCARVSCTPLAGAN